MLFYGLLKLFLLNVCNNSCWGIQAYSLGKRCAAKSACSTNMLTMPRRRFRGANLIITSFMVLVGVLLFTAFLEQKTRNEQTLKVTEVVNQLAALSKNLDFWVNGNRSAVPALLAGKAAVEIAASDQSHVINTSVTASPFVTRTHPSWNISYVIFNIAGQTLPYGAIIARPQTDYAKLLSPLVTAKATEYSTGDQPTKNKTIEYLRTILKTSGVVLTDTDVAFLSYCKIWCLRLVGHAAIWLSCVASIPSLNLTPAMTLAR